jgi:hypothetical protein
MNLSFIPLLAPDYPGIFPDFGILDLLIYAYTDKEISRAHSAWDGFCIVFIPTFIFVSWRITRRLMILSKRWKVDKLLKTFEEKDPFWNKMMMREMAENLFHQVQEAWFTNSFRSLAPVLTDKIKLEWQETWKQLLLNQYVFVVGNIDIRRVNIISVEDHLDNNQDKFQVEISGYIKRYVKDKHQGDVLYRGKTGYEAFTDIYSFIRYDDQWLLDGIHHGANLKHIMSLKNKDYAQQ